MTERKQISLQKNDRQAALDEYQRDGLIESADWLEDCADCMDDEGLDRDNHARHFRAGANAIRATLDRLSAPVGVPDGYKLVPIEPTSPQLDTAVAFALNVKLSGDYTWSSYMHDLYKAMISAAPQPPTTEEIKCPT